MKFAELRQTIRQGRITEDVVTRLLRKDESYPASLLFMAGARLLRNDKATARLLLERVDTEELADGIRNAQLPPAQITLATQIWVNSESIRQAVFESPFSPTAAINTILPRLPETKIEALAKDELRLILAPELIDTLLALPALDDELKEKLAELKEKIASDEELRLREEYQVENLSEEARETLLEEQDEEEEKELDEHKNIYAVVKQMTVAERAMLAMKANKTVRMLLVKDSNKLVARSVLRSPRLTESDVESIARTKEVDDEILRAISSNKRWMRKYSITKNLAFNPRTPLAISMTLTERLSNSDIRFGSRDHNIPAALRQHIVKVAHKRGIR